MSADLLSAYKAENRQQKLRQSRIGCLLALGIMPMGILLDYFVYPEYLASLASARILCSLAIVPTLALHHTAFGRANASMLPFTWPMIINLAICYMIYATGGSVSLYYAGLNIVLIGIIFILPLSIVESLIFSLTTVLLYIVTCGIAGNIAENFNVFYSNLNFLSLTAAVSCLVSHVNSKNSFEQFRLSFDLDIKNQQLTNLERLRTSFFANISHELRTPLTLILSPVQDLLAGAPELPPRVMQILQTTYANGLRLLKLVNELLEVIRIEEGKSQLHLKPLFIDAFLNELVDSIAYLSSKKQIHLERHFESPSVQILCDVHAIEKIVINLLHNAIKFSDDDSAISISTSHDAETICIVIADNGIGISEKELPFIFERFRQADSSTTRRYQGSGLGLSLARDLTEQLDGTIEVRSQLGVGTKFKLTFPVYRIVTGKVAHVAHDEETDALHKLYRLANRSGMLHLENSHQGAIEPARAPVPATRSAHTVLVVEDEYDLREYLVAALSDTYSILQAVDGEQALQLVQEHKPSLVVLDLMLPKIDGLDVCARIKQNEAYRGIRIILLTARIDENAKITALNNGADDFLTKPFSTLELQTRIRNLLQTSDFEQRLVATNQDLKQTLHELKDTQTQLIQSEKTHALEYLSAGILHEINNPLNYTLTALQLARGLPAASNDALLQEIFEDMREGMTRIKSIVGDLQSFAHPSPVDKQVSFKLAQAVRTALTFTSKDAGSVRIVDETDKDAQVIGSRNHIVQVLINLITNAVKAVRAVEGQRPGEILLRSTVDGARLVLSVRDNGTGIDSEILHKIFDPFFTTRDVGEGMGLGLAVSQTIVKAHGGQLRADSVAGEWTEFSFDLELDPKGA